MYLVPLTGISNVISNALVISNQLFYNEMEGWMFELFIDAQP